MKIPREARYTCTPRIRYPNKRALNRTSATEKRNCSRGRTLVEKDCQVNHAGWQFLPPTMRSESAWVWGAVCILADRFSAMDLGASGPFLTATDVGRKDRLQTKSYCYTCNLHSYNAFVPERKFLQYLKKSSGRRGTLGRCETSKFYWWLLKE